MEPNLTRKRWYRLIPIIFITFSLAYLDRANFGFALAGGMATDLGITTTISSLLGSLFFLGYFFFQIPGALYASDRSIKKLIFWSLILWGFLAMGTGLTNSVTLLIIIRFLLGVVESSVIPALLIFISRFFTKSERSRANTFLIVGNPATVLWMSIVSGHLIDKFGWREMFIIEGAPAIIWAFVWWFSVEDKIEDSRWLSGTQKSAVIKALEKEQKSITPVPNYWSAFKSKAVILMCLQYLFWNIAIGGFVIWLPSILKSSPAVDIVAVGWLSSIPYVLAVIGMLVASHYSDKLLKRREFIWPFLLIAALCLFGATVTGADNFWVLFVLLAISGGVVYAPLGPFFAIVTEILPRNVAGGAIGLINSFGALGSFWGIYLVGFMYDRTGNFNIAYLFLAGSLLISSIITGRGLKKRIG